ncbi:uncharacterized protein LOC129768595 [Toxorhynchites rutilus septentrionalis]|uniref:uncharacterized protein LOC129768595 n=1 Tax=Toxorhynchites rutilus septentrionalis TaxID=329112 RepID=UPI002479ADA8|nr:uncharacterized protein LOC129768595 [Toxorhynchites rutilus septentrionalis]
MELETLKCVLCSKFPEGEVYECSSRHIGCESCVCALNVRLCKCTEHFEKKKANPIVQLVKTAKTRCMYEEAGCTWLFGPQDMGHHLEECKFRPYDCIAEKLNMLSCDWSGLQCEIESHLANDHSVLGKQFSYYQLSEVPFSETSSKGSIKLIDAFSKKFLFYFFSSAATKMVYFMIIYFGRREEARQYCYEFEIRSKNEEEIPRLKFVEFVTADCEDFTKMRNEEKCVAISFKMIKRFVRDGSIPFRFIVKKAEKEQGNAATRERKISENNNTNKQRPTPTIFQQQGRGAIANNNNRNAPVGGSNSAPAGGGGSGGANRGQNKPIAASESAKPRSATVPIPPTGQRMPDYSSINRIVVGAQNQPLLMAPSINRQDGPPSYNTITGIEYSQSSSENCVAVNKPPPAECTTTATICRIYTQPYKTTDDRLYLQKYPKDCLGKPIIKR